MIRELEINEEYSKDINRVLASTIKWDPIDGLTQIFWKDIKQFKSRYLKDDIYEMPVIIMGDSSSSLLGFNIDEYKMFQRKESQCYLASYYGAKLTDSGVNLRANDKATVCKSTTDSCCEESYYKDLPKTWENEASLTIKHMQIIKL